MGDDVILIDDAINDLGFGRFQIIIIFISGIFQMGDCLEMVLISVLGPVLECEWHLTPTQAAGISTTVFCGAFVGTPIFGLLSDRFGRWNTLLLSCCMVSYYGLLCATSPSYVWLLILRCIIGITIPGMLASLVLTFELLPRASRGYAVPFINIFWGLGTIYESGLAYVCLTFLNWRWLTCLSALPFVGCLFAFLWLPESPRFLLLSGQEEEAKDVLHRVATANKKPYVDYRFQIDNKPVITSFGVIFKELINPAFRRSFLLLCVLWFNAMFQYYGLVLLNTNLPLTSHKCLQNFSQKSIASVTSVDVSCCAPLPTSVYITMVISGLGGVAGYAIAFVLTNVIGQRVSMAISLFMCSLLLLCLDFCVSPAAQTSIFFLLRMFNAFGFCFMVIYTAEAFPTRTRNLAIALCTNVGRIGGIVAPFVVQVIVRELSTIGGLGIFSASCILIAICVTFLPPEKRGLPLSETADDEVYPDPKNNWLELKGGDYSTFKE